MPDVPETKNALVLRTDFTDEDAWVSICEAIRRPAGGFRAYVDFVSDATFGGMGVERLLLSVPKNSNRAFMFVVDSLALSHPDQPILVLDLFEQPGRTFRVIPSEMWAVENNLSIANMDFAEFADAVDADGIFRGFPRS